eukprot:6179271-Pleurochrysis_carterae.AAC.11
MAADLSLPFTLSVTRGLTARSTTTRAQMPWHGVDERAVAEKVLIACRCMQPPGPVLLRNSLPFFLRNRAMAVVLST